MDHGTLGRDLEAFCARTESMTADLALAPRICLECCMEAVEGVKEAFPSLP
jgi:hypothetical protein